MDIVITVVLSLTLGIAIGFGLGWYVTTTRIPKILAKLTMGELKTLSKRVDIERNAR